MDFFQHPKLDMTNQHKQVGPWKGGWPWLGQSELTWSVSSMGRSCPSSQEQACSLPAWALATGGTLCVRRGSQRFWEMSFNQPNRQISSSQEKNGSSLLPPNFFYSYQSNSEHLSVSLKSISSSLCILSFSSSRSLLSLFHRDIFLHARATGCGRKWKCICSAAGLSSWHFPRERESLSLQQS